MSAPRKCSAGKAQAGRGCSCGDQGLGSLSGAHADKRAEARKTETGKMI